MKGVLDKIDVAWGNLTTPKAMLLGVVVGVVTGIIPQLIFGETAFVVLLFYPFLMRAAVILFLIHWSERARVRFVGEKYLYDAIGAHLAFCKGKYFLFCLSWMFTLGLYGCWLQGDC